MGVDSFDTLRRVTIIAPQRRVDLALPASMTLRELMPRLLELADVPPPDAAASLHGWTLQRVGEFPLDPDVLVAALGLSDGDFLHLLPGDDVMPDAAVDDVVDALTLTTARRTGWTSTHTRFAALAAAVVLLLVVPGMLSWPVLVDLARGRRPVVPASMQVAWTTALAVAMLVAGAAGVVAARTGAPRGVAETLEDLALTMASAVGTWTLPLGATITQRIAVSAALVILISLVLWISAPVNHYPLFVVGTMSALMLVTTLIEIAWRTSGPRTAAVALVVIAALAPVCPHLAVRMSGLPLDQPPGSEALETPDLVRRAIRADRLHAALLWTGCLTTLLLSVSALSCHGPAILVLCGLLALTAVLRARHHVGFHQRLALLSLGGALGTMTAVRTLWLFHTPGLAAAMITASIILAIAALTTVLFPGAVRRLGLTPVAAVLEWTVVAALVPTLLWVLDVFTVFALN